MRVLCSIYLDVGKREMTCVVFLADLKRGGVSEIHVPMAEGVFCAKCMIRVVPFC